MHGRAKGDAVRIIVYRPTSRAVSRSKKKRRRTKITVLPISMSCSDGGHSSDAGIFLDKR